MTAVNITRPAGGISLNAGIREFLLDKPDGEKMEFQSRGVAIAFLMNTFDYTWDKIQELGLEFPEIEELSYDEKNEGHPGNPNEYGDS